MKKTAKLLSIILALIICLGTLPLSASAAPNIASGDFGSGASGSWVIDASGKLTISGEIRVNAVINYNVPWYQHASSIKTVVFSQGSYVKSGSKLSYLFNDCINLTEIDFSNLNSANATSMNFMFNNCSSLTSLNLSGLNTSSVTTMFAAFADCTSLTSLNLSGFNTSSVTNMSCMFTGCTSLTSLNLSGFNTSSVTNMEHMFSRCSSLTSLNLSGFNTSSVTDMYGMFNGCSSLTSLNLSGFNTSSVEDMGYMFNGCTNLTSLNLSSFNTELVGLMYYMFEDCRSLTTLNLSSFTTPNIRQMRYMFKGCTALTSVDLSNITSCGNNTNSMFEDCPNLTSLNLLNCRTPSTSMENMFKNCGKMVSGASVKCYVYNNNTAAAFNNSAVTGVDSNRLRFYGREIPSVTVTGVYEPVAGETARWDYNIPPNQNYSKFVNPNNDTCVWIETDERPTNYFDLEDGINHFKSGGNFTFKATKYYTFLPLIVCDSNHFFSYSLTATINGNNTGMTPDSESGERDSGIWYCFGQPDSDYNIQNITVSGLAEPVVNAEMSWDYDIPGGQGYSKYDVYYEDYGYWIETDYEVTTSNFEDAFQYKANESDAHGADFIDDRYYTYVACLKPDTNCWFSDTVSAKINGIAANYYKDENKEYSCVWYCFPKTVAQKINTVEITGVAEPVVNGEISLDWNIPSNMGYSKREYYDSNYGYWVETNSAPTTIYQVNHGTIMTEGTFSPNKYYTFVATIECDLGYVLSDTATLTINGQPAQGGSRNIWYCFGKLNPVSIDFVDIMDVTPPVAGETPSFNYHLPSDSGYVMDTPTYSAWIETDILPTTLSDYDDGTHHFVDDGDFEFNPDKYYSFRADIIAEEGYSFSNSLVAEINGCTAYIESLDSTHQTIMFCFGKPAASISSIVIEGVTAPVIDKTPKFDWGIPSNSGYVKAGEMNCAWVETDAPPESFFDIENGTPYWNTDGSFSFDSNKYYTFRADVMAEAGYNFSSSLSATLNTKTANVKNQPGYKTVWYYFGKPTATVNIDSVVITNVTLPVAGATPNFDFAIPSGAGYTVSSNYFDWIETDSEPTTLSDYDDGTYYSDVDGGFTFDPDKYYSFRVTVKAKEGYAFSNPITAEMNGNAAYVEWRGNTQQCIMYCFGKPKALSSISVTTQPTKTVYNAGESFEPAGMVVKANYSDSTSANITGYTVTDGNNLAAGKTSVTVSYTEGGVTKTTTVPITVNIVIIPTVAIKNNPGTREIKYGDGIEFTAVVTDLPAGAQIKWYVNGAEKGTGTTFTFSDAKADATITVKIVDGSGNALTDAGGSEISDTETVKVKAGFFQKLISFFKNLFRIGRITVQKIY